MKNLISLVVVFGFGVFLACQKSAEGVNKNIITENASVVKISEGTDFAFVEGPVWDGKEYLYFTDIPNNLIYKYSLQKKSFTVFRENSGAANGLMFDSQGRLVTCEGGTGRLTAMDMEGHVVAVLADSFKGNRFNGPNDLVIDSFGGIYFTDPDFGLDENRPQEKKGVYYRRTDGSVICLYDEMNKPNGVILSTDGSILYVVDTSSPYVKAFDVHGEGYVGDPYIFAQLKMPEGAEGRTSGADGLAMDTLGDLYVTTSLGIQIFSPDGDYIDIITVPEVPANCAFGGADMKTLFITARKNVYSIGLNVPGVVFPLKASPVKEKQR
jgi:gluconolactonase